jgi:metal-sulfur cluster biosynthetic enzyme
MKEINIITNDEEKLKLAIDALKFVMDPEIGLNVADLGLIYQIDFDESDKKVYCTHTLTTQFCPMGESIQSGVTNALEETFPDYGVVVKIIFEPHWNSQMISDDGRDFLNR